MTSKQIILLVSVNVILSVALVLLVLPYLNDMDISQPVMPLVNSQYELQPNESRVVNIVQSANSAVLSIVVSQDVPIYEQYFEPFGPFGFQIPRQRQRGTEERQVGSGSGFIVSQSGLVVTNRHVVDQKDADYVGMDDSGNKYELELIEKDPILDIAILQIKDADDLPFLSFANSDQLQVGQTVIAIGNALGEFSNSVSVGVVSGLSRSIIAGSNIYGDQELLENVIQTDAAINPGNSGGPLFNLDGQVIGVNVAVARGSENIGFALPSNAVQSIVNSVIEHGRIVRPYLGVRYVMIDDSVQEQFDLESSKGVLIYGSGSGFAVDPNSPAANAGLLEGDIVISVNDIQLGKDNSLASVIRMFSPGDEIVLKILRNGERLNLSIVLEEFKD